MQSAKRPIIVLTPVRNEAWILPHFLSITSQFADAIIIADQNSEDGSMEMYGNYSKVVVIHNDYGGYSESERQSLLLKEARRLFPGEKLILTLDADEIATPEAVKYFLSNDIQLHAPGTALLFEKPDLQAGLKLCWRHRESPYPMGFIDNDLLEHTGKQIHNIRFPFTSCNKQVVLENPYFLHYSYVRPMHQRAKFRFYAVQEALLGTSPWYRRRRRYRSPNHLLMGKPLEPVQDEWFFRKSTPVVNLIESRRTWYDDLVEKTLLERGSLYFWLDDIWDFPWHDSIPRPPQFVRIILSYLDKFYR